MPQKVGIIGLSHDCLRLLASFLTPAEYACLGCTCKDFKQQLFDDVSLLGSWHTRYLVKFLRGHLMDEYYIPIHNCAPWCWHRGNSKQDYDIINMHKIPPACVLLRFWRRQKSSNVWPRSDRVCSPMQRKKLSGSLLHSFMPWVWWPQWKPDWHICPIISQQVRCHVWRINFW